MRVGLFAKSHSIRSISPEFRTNSYVGQWGVVKHEQQCISGTEVHLVDRNSSHLLSAVQVTFLQLLQVSQHNENCDRFSQRGTHVGSASVVEVGNSFNPSVLCIPILHFLKSSSIDTSRGWELDITKKKLNCPSKMVKSDAIWKSCTPIQTT